MAAYYKCVKMIEILRWNPGQITSASYLIFLQVILSLDTLNVFQ